MFLLLKNNLTRKHGIVSFRIIGMDLSWATIHDSWFFLNKESVNEYGKR
jgi:hypothetical protein